MKKLWNFLITIIDYLNPFSENFILKKVWEFLSNIISYINPWDDNFLGKKIVELFGNLLQWLFVPDEKFFDNNIEEIKGKIAEKIPYQDYIDLFETVKTVSSGENLSVDLPEYQISDNLTIKKQKFVDFGHITKYRDTWYGWVRGFTFIFMIIYNLNQITKFLRGFNVADGAIVVGMNHKGGKN